MTPAERLLASLPAVYRQQDGQGELARLLAVFGALFFDGDGDGTDRRSALPGIERMVQALPALFAPGPDAAPGEARAPDAFVHWLAAWLGFTPHALFSTDALRRIVAAIVPLYGLRGSRDYLQQLLQLCFGLDAHGVAVDDRPRVGLVVGSARLGSGTRLIESRPFWFRVVVVLGDDDAARLAQDGPAPLERRLRAVIDFAKPAHTAYELQLQARAAPTATDGQPA